MKTALESKTEELIRLRAEIAKLDEEYEKKVSPLKTKKDACQQEVLEKLSRSNQYSVRYDFATVTRAVRKRCIVTDEQALIEHLKEQGLGDEYVAERLTASAETLLKEIAKGAIETPVGTAIEEKEYISIKLPSEEKDRRKTTTE